jgi:hypothetical protein
MILCASAGGFLLITSIWAGQTSVYPPSLPPVFAASPLISPVISEAGVAIGAFLLVAAVVQDIVLVRRRRHGDFGEKRNAHST